MVGSDCLIRAAAQPPRAGVRAECFHVHGRYISTRLEVRSSKSHLVFSFDFPPTLRDGIFNFAT